MKDGSAPPHAGTAHNHTSSMDFDEIRTMVAEFKAEQKAHHQARIEERRQQRLAAKGQGPQFIGPPDPRQFRNPVRKATKMTVEK